MTRSPDKYLLFCTAMVQAYLAGRKTQTRRLVKPQPLPGGTVYYDDQHGGWLRVQAATGFAANWWQDQQCPYGLPGQLIHGKETFVEAHPGYIYLADCETRQGIRWTPSIFMPVGTASPANAL